MMDPGEARDFFGRPPHPPAKWTHGDGRTDEAEEAAASGQAAAGGQAAVNFPPMRDPNQDLHVPGNDSNISPQCSTEWPSDWFVEEPRAIYQDWSMPTGIDLNMDCNIQQEEMQANDLDESIWPDNPLGDDIEYESQSSDASNLEEEIDWQKEGYIDVPELFPVTNEEELNEEPAVDKAALAREARSKAAKANAIRTRELKLRAAAGTIDDGFVLSDSCSDDNKELINGDDDGAVLESQIVV